MKSYGSFNEMAAGAGQPIYCAVSNATNVTAEQCNAVNDFYNNILRETEDLRQTLTGSIQYSPEMDGLISAVRIAAGKVIQGTHRGSSDRISPVGAEQGRAYWKENNLASPQIDYSDYGGGEIPGSRYV